MKTDLKMVLVLTAVSFGLDGCQFLPDDFMKGADVRQYNCMCSTLIPELSPWTVKDIQEAKRDQTLTDEGKLEVIQTAIKKNGCDCQPPDDMMLPDNSGASVDETDGDQLEAEVNGETEDTQTDGDITGDAEAKPECVDRRCGEISSCCDGCNFINEGAICDDGNRCTTRDTCHQGKCLGDALHWSETGSELANAPCQPCDSDDECATRYFCVENHDFAYKFTGKCVVYACDWVTVDYSEEKFEYLANCPRCVEGGCDDQNPCTEDTCEGECVHENLPDGAPCGDTSNWQCHSGNCTEYRLESGNFISPTGAWYPSPFTHIMNVMVYNISGEIVILDGILMEVHTDCNLFMSSATLHIAADEYPGMLGQIRDNGTGEQWYYLQSPFETPFILNPDETLLLQWSVDTSMCQPESGDTLYGVLTELRDRHNSRQINTLGLPLAGNILTAP